MRFRDALAPRLAVQTFDCCAALRADGQVPRKDLLCPPGLPPAAWPHIMPMEWMGEGEEFRCRLMLPVSCRGEAPDCIVMVVFIDEAAHPRLSIALDETHTYSGAELG